MNSDYNTASKIW